MPTTEIAQSIKKEHNIVEHLIDELRKETAIVPRGSLQPWIEQIMPQFEHFRAHMTKHMALEEVDGYMSPVMVQLPTLQADVERLGHEHAELMKIMDGIYDQLRELEPDDHLLARDCCRRISDLLCYIEHHEHDESRLMTFAFSQEFGTKD